MHTLQRHIIFAALCLLPMKVLGQNMVQNGDFEQYSSCTPFPSSIVGWQSYTTVGTPDYFSPCYGAVPSNGIGYQMPASGNAYVGLYNFGWGEYLAGTMTPLTQGVTYEVSMSVSLAERSLWAASGMGVWFYDNGSATSTALYLTFVPQIFYNNYGPITDTVNWIRLTANFTADSTYDNIVIGNFAYGTSMVLAPSPTGDRPISYYYIDSVVVKKARIVKIDSVQAALCPADTMKVNFSTLNVFSSSNTFTLQLSDANGSFTSPVNIGTATGVGMFSGPQNGVIKYVIPSTVAPGAGYRLRMKSNSPADSIIYDGSITIGAYPTNLAVSSNAPICTTDTLKLSGSASGSNISYKWTGPSLNAIGQNISLTGLSAAASNYYVLHTSILGCECKDSVSVTVKQSPASITAIATGGGSCEPQAISLTSSGSSAGVTYTWSGPNSFSYSGTTNAVFSYPNASALYSGRYYVTATAANGCFKKDSVDVVIKPLPANFSATSNTPVCQGGALNLNGNTTSTGVTFNWSGPNSYIATLQNPVISNAQPSHSGDYILTATLNGCSIKDTATVTVIAIPPTPMPTANTPVCIGQTLNLNAGGSTPGYLWSGPASFSSNVQNPSLTGANATMAGVYTVKAYDGACASPAANVTVNVIASPTANMYPSPKDSICTGTMVTFFASSSNAGTAPVYKWYHNNTLIPGASGSSYNTNTTADYDEYYCTVTSNGTCATPYTINGNTIQMRVFPWMTPAVSITSTNPNVNGGDLITFTATPVNGGNFPTYQWKRNNKDVVGALSYTWGAKTLDDKDNVCVTMTSSYICPNPKIASSNCIKVNINTTGIDEATFSKVNIYPNPVNNELVIEGIAKNTKIQLLDVLGRTVISITSTKDKEVLNTSSLLPGAYVLQLHSANGKQSARMVKE